jgi:hypothetical protein
VSSIPIESVKVEKKYHKTEKTMTESEQKEATVKAMFIIAAEQGKGKPLVQNAMEGVADDEW